MTGPAGPTSVGSQGPTGPTGARGDVGPTGAPGAALGIPGGVALRELNQVIGSSWRHETVVNVDEFLNTYRRCGAGDGQRGLVVRFKGAVRAEDLNERTIQVVCAWDERHDQFTDRFGNSLGVVLRREQVLPMRVQAVHITATAAHHARWVGAPAPPDEGPFEVVNGFSSAGEVDGMRVWLGLAADGNLGGDQREEAIWRSLLVSGGQFQLHSLTVVVHGSMIRSAGDDLPLDGDHIAPYVPLRPSGNGTPGGDWHATLYIEH